jgi:hemerythrin-like domain-containing protein
MATNAKSKSKGRARKSTTTAKRSIRRRVTKPRASVSSGLAETAGKMLAGAANAVRALVPQLEPSDGATKLLEKQHREVERSFATALDSDDPKVRRTAMKDIIDQLTMHTDIEEAIFYPAVRGIGTEQANDMILEAVEEHHVVKLVLKELPRIDPKAETFEAKMTVLKELVAHHVEEEEHEMFPMAERKLGAERSRELAEAMAARAAKQ